MGARQLLIIALVDSAIAVAIARVAGPRERRGIGYLAVAGAVGLPFAFLAVAPFFLSSGQPAVAPSPAEATACPPSTRASASGPRLGQLHFISGWVAGSVDASLAIGNTAHFCGWAASVNDRRAADLVLVFADGHFAAAVKPALSRPDVARAEGGVGANSGFSITLPRGAVEPGGKKASVRIFAVERGIASSLAFNCKTEPHDLGC